MQDHALQVGDELVIGNHARLTILAVEEDEVVLGIITELKGARDPVDRQWRTPLVAVPVSLLSNN
jgi:hypothetical protein